MSYLQNALNDLRQFGVFDVLVPFILVFVIMYATLHKTKILGDKNKNFNIALSLVIALIFITVTPVVEIVNTAIPHVAVVAVAIVMLLILIGLFGHEVTLAGGSLAGWAAAIAIVTVVYIFGDAAGWWDYGWPNFLSFMNDAQTQATVIVLLVFGLVIWFITREDKDEKKEGFFEKLGKMIEKK